MKKTPLVYNQRGVSTSKRGVHRAIRQLNPGLYPGAFCKISHHLDGDRRRCSILHSDTAGTNAALAALAYLEDRKNLRFLRSPAVASAVMNTDDVACVGSTGPFLISQTVGYNALLFGDEVYGEIITGLHEFCATLEKVGIDCRYASGETASVGCNVRSIDVGASITTSIARKDVIDAGRISPGDLLVGFSSTGKAAWEKTETTGVGANGITSARHDLLNTFYRKQMHTYNPLMRKSLVYRGNYFLHEKLVEDPRFTVLEALLSPVRTYLPLVWMILQEIDRKLIHGFIHCSGGGQTKIKGFGKPGNVYVKDDLFPTPPIFDAIQKMGKVPWYEMFKVYNMGHRFEAAVRNAKTAKRMIDIARSVGIDAKVIGYVEKGMGNGRKVVIKSFGCEFQY